MSTDNQTRPDANTKASGLIWVALAGLLFVIFIIIIRYIGTSVHPVQAAFIRYALGLLVLLPLFLKTGIVLFQSERVSLHAIRGGVHAIGVLLWFFAITELQIAEATAMSFMSPIFVAIGAVIFLGERLSWRRVMVIMVGICGVLLILRPGFREFNMGALAMLMASPLFATSKLLVKHLVGFDSAGTVVAYLSVFATLTMLLPAVYVWQTPNIFEMMLLFGTAVFATGSHLCMSKGLSMVDVTVAQPVEFLQLVWSTLLGIVFFSETPSIWIWVGAGVIVLSASYIARYEYNIRNTLTGTPR
ncbi:MAG: DMT family transporter [Arenicellales bacterium WSBS_2016_MAG_OTU3]